MKLTEEELQNILKRVRQGVWTLILDEGEDVIWDAISEEVGSKIVAGEEDEVNEQVWDEVKKCFKPQE
jgi:hypothetical protein